MNSFHTIDMATWKRRELFAGYQKFDTPCYTVSAKVPAEPLFACAKERRESAFLLALYGILRAANQVPQLRQRILDGNVVEFDQIDGMTPIMASDEQFREAWCAYYPDFAAFRQNAQIQVEAAKQGIAVELTSDRQDFLCASCLPWLHFEAVAAADYDFYQSVPILSWGKYMHGVVPVSIKVNHCFVDGLHLGWFFEHLEQYFTNPEALYGNV